MNNYLDSLNGGRFPYENITADAIQLACTVQHFLLQRSLGGYQAPAEFQPDSLSFVFQVAKTFNFHIYYHFNIRGLVQIKHSATTDDHPPNPTLEAAIKSAHYSFH